MESVSSPSDPVHPELVLHVGRRATLALRAAFLVAIAVFGAVALAIAIGRPSGDGQGGAGNVVLPAAAVVFALLGLAFTLGQWWDDATHLRVVDGHLEVRHGGRRLRGRAVRYSLDHPVLLIAEGPRDSVRMFVEQDQRRVDLGKADQLGADQLRDLGSWLRSQGVRFEQRTDR